jgi:hypothetical protein
MSTEVRTTDGVIALHNLQAQVASLEHLAHNGCLNASDWGDLIDLLALRGQILGCAEDIARARTLAAQRGGSTGSDGWDHLRLARTHDWFHQFAEALANLASAERQGVPSPVVNAERALVLHHLGRTGDALRLAHDEAGRRPGFSALATLAVLHAERDEPAEAERFFEASRAQYRCVSPFPIAQLDLQRGRMWLRQGHLPQARRWFTAVVQRVPGHVPAQQNLATINGLQPGV